MSGERQLCRKPFTVILALSFHGRKMLARFDGDASLSLSMTFTCHSEPTPSRVLCRTRLFGHSRGAKEEKEVNRGNRPTRNFRANESKMENSFSICRVPQKISLAESLTVCLRFFGVTPLRMIIMSFRARPIGRRGISDSLSVEILHSAYVSFRMTCVLQEILPPYGRQNDSIL